MPTIVGKIISGAPSEVTIDSEGNGWARITVTNRRQNVNRYIVLVRIGELRDAVAELPAR